MSVKIFYGDDRMAAQEAIRVALGKGYEVIEGAELAPGMMPSVFLGASLLESERRIVIKDLAENKAAFEKLENYLATPHEIIVWESKLDKRSVGYKALAKAGVEMREFKTKLDYNPRAVFDIYDTALRDGVRALRLLAEIQDKQDPFMLVGLMATQAIRDFERRGGAREKRVLAALAELDLDMKSATVEPWALVKSFLLRLPSI